MWLNRLTVAMRPVWQLYWNLELLGEVAAIPRTGPLIVAANHGSYLDPWFMSITFPRGLHHLINRDWYEKSAVWKAFFLANGTVPITPQDPTRTLQSISQMLDRGKVVSMFPEGRISRDGRIQPFRSGIAFIAARTGVPVVPLGVRGAFESLPRHARIPKRRTVAVHVGRPLTFERSAPGEAPAPADIRRFRDRLFDEVCRLAGQQPAGVEQQPRATSGASNVAV